MEPVGGATAATKGALHFVRIGDTTKRNNRLALRQYEDLVRWARDEVKAEATELEATREKLASRGMLDSGQAGFEDGEIRDHFAQRWRDRKSAAERALEDLHDSENVLHRRWRDIVGRPWPENPRGEEIELLTADWDARAR